MPNYNFKQTVTAMEGVDNDAAYVYAKEMTSRAAIDEAYGANYSVYDYCETPDCGWDRYSIADCWVVNTTTGYRTLWELKTRNDIRISTYQESYIKVKKVQNLLKKRASRKTPLDIYIGILFPKDKCVVVYPIDAFSKFGTEEVKAWDPDKKKYVLELNYLVPVGNYDRIHDAGGYVRHWHAFDWDDAYETNMMLGQELSARGEIR